MTTTKKAAPTAPDAARKVYRALVPYSYELHGESKNGWTEVGIGFTSKDGEGVNIELRPGISVAGRIVLRPIDTKGDDGAAGGSGQPVPGQGIPRFIFDPTRSKEDLV